MTVADLIFEVLTLIRNQFYADRVREFKRDERALMKAITRYGYECNRRHWQFQTQFIFKELSALLLKIRTRGAQIEYLPVYLEGAVDRHIRTRAEELSAEAKRLNGVQVLAPKLATAVPVAVVARPSDVETMDLLFKELRRHKRAARKVRQATAQAKQEALL